MPSQNYNTSFFETQSKESFSSAKIVVPIIHELLHPKSLIDVGCGVGAWTKEFEIVSKCSILGMDGDYVQQDQLLIHPDRFMGVDLNISLPQLEKQDLAICLEVAEHLPKDRAESFIKELTNYSDTILFSAAIPFQGGTNHINEQPLSYWINIFNQNGFDCIDCIRPAIWDNKKIQWWYRQNLVLFIKKGSDKSNQLLSKKSFSAKDIVTQEALESLYWKSNLSLREKSKLESNLIYAIRVNLSRLKRKYLKLKN